LASKVFVWPITGTISELCKDLVLSGINLNISDDSLISFYDIEANVLFAFKDLGKKVLCIFILLGFVESRGSSREALLH